MPSGIYKRIKNINSGLNKGKHWKVKDTTKMRKSKSEEQKQKLKKYTLRRYQNNEKFGFQKGNTINRGVILSKEHKQKIRDKMKSFYRLGGIHPMKGRLGKDNPNYGSKRSEETKQKLRKKRTENAKRNMKKSRSLFFQNGGVGSRKGAITSETTKQKQKEWHIAHPNKKFSGTKIELKMREELNRRGFIKDADYFCNIDVNKIANVDIYLPAYKIVIECDGCHYHPCKLCKIFPKERHSNDALKTKQLRKAGYIVYRFWEHEINKDVGKCVDSINL